MFALLSENSFFKKKYYYYNKPPCSYERRAQLGDGAVRCHVRIHMQPRAPQIQRKRLKQFGKPIFASFSESRFLKRSTVIRRAGYTDLLRCLLSSCRLARGSSKELRYQRANEPLAGGTSPCGHAEALQ